MAEPVNVGTIARVTGNAEHPGNEIHLFPSFGPAISAIAVVAGIGAAAIVGTLTLGVGLAIAVPVVGAVTYELTSQRNGQMVLTAPPGYTITFTETLRDPLTRQESGTHTVRVVSGSHVTIEASDGKDHLLRGFSIAQATLGENVAGWWNENGWWVAIAGLVGGTVATVILIDRAKKQNRIIKLREDEKAIQVSQGPYQAKSAAPAALASMVTASVKAGGDVTKAAIEADSKRAAAKKEPGKAPIPPEAA